MEFPQEFLHSYMFRGKYLLRGTFYCNEAIIHENDPIRNIFGKIHLVGNNYHSDVFGCQILNNLQDLSCKFRVKGGCWFIEKQNIRVHTQSPGNGNSLLLSAGELVGVIVFFVGIQISNNGRISFVTDNTGMLERHVTFAYSIA